MDTYSYHPYLEPLPLLQGIHYHRRQPQAEEEGEEEEGEEEEEEGEEGGGEEGGGEGGGRGGRGEGGGVKKEGYRGVREREILRTQKPNEEEA